MCCKKLKKYVLQKTEKGSCGFAFWRGYIALKNDVQLKPNAIFVTTADWWKWPNVEIQARI